MKTRKKVLLQAVVSSKTGRQFDALAKASGRKRAAYLRRLVELHVTAVTPKLVAGLERAWDGVDVKGAIVDPKEAP